MMCVGVALVVYVLVVVCERGGSCVYVGGAVVAGCVCLVGSVRLASVQEGSWINIWSFEHMNLLHP